MLHRSLPLSIRSLTHSSMPTGLPGHWRCSNGGHGPRPCGAHRSRLWLACSRTTGEALS